MNVSILSTITSKEKPKVVDVTYVLDKIKTGGGVSELVDELRSLPEVEYKKRKRELPIVLFGGVFEQRSIEGFREPSELLVLDFDDVKNIEAKRKSLQSKPYMFCVFLSPSGRGLKCLVRIPKCGNLEYGMYFDSLRADIQGIDRSGRDISRCCFISKDPDIYINQEAETYTRKVQPLEKKDTRKKTDFRKLGVAVEMIRAAEDGEKHHQLIKAARLVGGYIAGGAIDRATAEKILEDEIRAKDIVDPKGAIQTIKDGIEYGLKLPISSSEFKALEKSKAPVTKMYLQMADIEEQVIDFYENGYPRGEDIGWESAKDKITILKGSTTYIYGAPFMGKTQVWFEILINLSISQGWRHFILSPETGEAKHVFGELCSIYAGSSFQGDFKMDDSERKTAMDFIASHFIVMEYDGEGVDMEGFLEQVTAAELEYSITFDTVTIDPLNYLDTNLGKFGGREDKALSRDLRLFLGAAKVKNRHHALITHVRDQQMRQTQDGTQYFYPVPTPRDLAGGQVFFRHGMQMICVNRPVDIHFNPLPDEDGIPCEPNATDVWIQKSKPKGIGFIGKLRLYYDFKRNKYYEQGKLSGNDVYALEQDSVNVSSSRTPYKED